MRFIGFLFLSTVITFGLVAYGYWLRIFVEIFDGLEESRKGLGMVVFVVGAIGIILALTGMFLL